MSGLFRAVAAIAPVALFAFSSVGAQVPAPMPTIHSHEAGAAARSACRSASRVATVGAHERVALLCPDSLELAAIHDLTDLLSSRIPGVLVQETSGTPGSAARIRIRGPGSILLEDEPIIVLDGVRVLGTPARASLFAPQFPSRLDDIDVDDIATIEVLRGPATSAMYGTGAAGGVIRITTKRGTLGPPRVNAFAGAGTVVETTNFPSNYSQPGTFTSSGEPTLNCTLDARARGICTPDGSALQSFNPLEQASPFRRGLRQDLGASISGGAERLGYHAAVGHSRENGVLDDSDLARMNLRLNLDARPIDELSIALTTAWLAGEAQFPRGEYNSRGVIINGLLGSSQDDPVNRGYLAPLDSFRRDENRQDVTRLDVSVSARWTPIPWMEVAAGIGVDETDTDDLERLPFSYAPSGEIRTIGDLRVDRETAAASLTAFWSSGGWLQGSTRFGFDRNETDFEQGSRTDDGSGFGSSWRRWMRLKHEGLYIHQRLGWLDRVTLDAGLRRDDFDRGSFNPPSRTSRSAALSWLARRAPAGGSAFGNLRFHLAYGDVPGTGSSLDFPLIFLPPNAQPRPLKTERTAELEGGAVAAILRGRVRLSVTAYRKTTRDAFSMLFDPMYNLTTIGNGARLRNKGVEATARALVLDTRPLAIDLEAGMWRNSNKALSLERGQNYVQNGAWQQHAEGYPLGGYWHRRIVSYDDLNGDGMISRVNCPGQPQVAGGPACEIEIGTQEQYLGSPIPRLEVFFAPKLSLFGRIEMSALLDHRSGFEQYNQTAAARCNAGRCRAASDPSAPLADQARLVAAGMGAAGGYVEDATFTKLREVSVSLGIPQAWTGAIGGRSARFTLAGRNLATWTGYTGLDPEVSGPGPLGFGQAETFTQPPLRHYTARLSVGW